MPKFSRRSLEKLKDAHPLLQIIAEELIKEMDVTVLCTYRGKKEQDDAFRAGNTKVRWPNSKHNLKPSRAIDLVPYPIDWSDADRFADMRRRVERIAEARAIKLRPLIKWDAPHVELK